MANDADEAWAATFDDEAWGGPLAARLGELIDLRSLPTLVATLDGERAGIARYEVRGEECEVVSIASKPEGQGVARALLDAIRAIAVEHGSRRVWLVTTNDNIRALRVYQQYGFNLVALHLDAVTRARQTIKPSLPERGSSGIRMAHELELELELTPELTRAARGVSRWRR
jgi:ribosomal protein S18 acetylase RimI-like enzyme